MTEPPSDARRAEAGADSRAQRGAAAGAGQLARNVLSSWAGLGVFVAAGFVLPRFIKDRLGGDVLGVWDFGWSFYAYFQVLSLGLTSAVNRYVARYRVLEEWGALNRAVNSSLFLLNIAAGAAAVGAVAAAVFLAALLHSADSAILADARWVVLLLGLCAAVELPQAAFRGVLNGYERFDLRNLVVSGLKLLSVALMVGVLFAGYGVVALAWISLGGSLATAAFMVVAARRICPTFRLSRRFITWAECREMLVFGGKTALQNVARTVAYQTNAVLIANTAALGLGGLALFSRQRSLVQAVERFVLQYAYVFVPTSAARQALANDAALRSLLIATTRIGLLVALPALTYLAVMGPPLLHVWMGPEFTAAGLIAVLAAGHLLPLAARAPVAVLQGAGQHGWPAVFSVASAIGVLVASAAVRMSGGGLVAYALALTLPLAVGDGVLPIGYACRCVGLRTAALVSAVVPPALACTLPLAAVLGLCRVALPDRPLAALGASVVVGGPVFVALAWRIGLPAGLRERISGALRRRLGSRGAARRAVAASEE